MTLIFGDLLVYDHGSIAWVQIHRRADGDAVALVTHPTDSPGCGPINAAESLHKRITETFPDVSDLQIFIRFVRDGEAPSWFKLIPGRDEMEFEREVPPSTVEALCPAAAQLSWDTEEHSCAALGGAEHPLLALVPAPEPEHNPIDELAVVAVAELAWAHNPFKCAHVDRFRTVERLYGATEDFAPPAAGAHWFASLTADDFQRCGHHDADWKQVAAASVEIFHGLSRHTKLDGIPELAEQQLGRTAEAGWCQSLFSDPIRWSPGWKRVENGQHRTCALKGAGAPLCVVEVGDVSLPEPVLGDPRRRACAEIAQFWADRAGR